MNWIEWRALHKLYQQERVDFNETLLKSKEINFLIHSLKVVDRSGKYLEGLPDYPAVYEQKYFERYKRYHQFLTDSNLLRPQTRYEETDIIALQKVYEWEKEGRLDSLRTRVLNDEETLRGVSDMFFKNEKYLDDRPSLINAMKQLLKVDSFANEKDQQYIYKLECHQPKLIVLCENIDYLMKPVQPRKHQVELWYAGGKNIDKLTYADNRGLPVYYSCDWDYDGLYIIYPLVKAKVPGIQLLTPTGSPRDIIESNHNSKWDQGRQSLKLLDLSSHQTALLEQIVINNQWIIEESNDLIAMLKNAGVIEE